MSEKNFSIEKSVELNNNVKNSKEGWDDVANMDESWENHLEKAIEAAQIEADELRRSGKLSDRDFLSLM